MIKIKERLLEHVADSVAVASVTNPVMAILETNVAGMSNNTSTNARVLGTALTFAGLGSLYSKGRDLSKKIFGINEKTSEKIKQFHDTVYGAAYLLTITPPFYYAAGSRDSKEIAMGTMMAAVTGIVGGGVAGYAVDAFRDLFGIKDSERVPELLERQKPFVKKITAVALAAISVGACTLVYSINDYIK